MGHRKTDSTSLTRGVADPAGSFYPALHRPEQQALIKAKWAETDTGRQAIFNSLTTAGRARLEKEEAQWRRLLAVIDWVVEGT
jgi:PadR family transcriptional regulator, regulatory protein PadR